MPNGCSAGSRRLTGTSWWQDAPEGTGLSRLGHGMLAWLTEGQRGLGSGCGGEILKIKLWEAVQMQGL